MSLPGKMAVGQTGAASYSIPIALPPGTAGMAPSLSLDYSSQGGNGLLGVGWSLSGLPSIGRCPRTIAQDGAVGGINYDANDRFCMDGQRLVAISGTYGADGTQYRTEVESYSKIISHGNAGTAPAWFEVHTKSGQTMEFGNTTDSRVLGINSSARIWAVNKVSDTKSNYFTVTYYTANGQYYPTRIDYTGNSAAGVSPYNSVIFGWDNRPDVISQYQSGALIQTGLRMREVLTYVGSAVVSDYKFTYQLSPSSNRSQITSVAACGADGACLPATNFQWASGGGTITMSAQPYTLPNGWDFGTPPRAYRVPVSGDFNGDGISDIVMASNDGYYSMLGNGDGTFRAVGVFAYPNGANFGNPVTANYATLSGDFNGDGKTDLIMLGDSYYYVYLGNGDGTFGGPGGYPYAAGSHFGAPPSSLYMPFTGDFNGDGRTDFALINGTNYWTFISNGNGTFTETIGANPNGWNFGTSVPVLVSPVRQFASTAAVGQYNLLPGDYDGDGRTDFAMLSNNASYVLLSNGDGTFRGAAVAGYPLGSNYGGPPTYQYALFPGDFNGDGKADFAVVGGNTYWCYLGKGDGTFAETSNTLSNGWNFGNPPVSHFLTFTSDLNGDGRSDLALLSDGGYYFLVSNGDGSFTPKGGSGYAGGFSFGSMPATYWEPFPGDYNGDGISDITFVRDHSYVAMLTNGGVRDVITSVTGGLGAVVTVTYAPGTNSSVVTKGTGTTFPTVDLIAPIYVVSRLDTSNGIGGTYSSSYSYSGPRIDTRGRGFLGFAQTSIKDLQTNITDTTNYRQDFPFISLVASSTRTVGTQTLGQSTNTYQSYDTSGAAPYHVYLTQNVSSGSDLDGSALPTVTTSNQYDAYLNATQVVVSTPDGFSKTTTNTYSNDPTLWYLGRLTRASVTSVAP